MDLPLILSLPASAPFWTGCAHCAARGNTVLTRSYIILKPSRDFFFGMCLLHDGTYCWCYASDREGP
jgi:hypothetical protein